MDRNLNPPNELRTLGELRTRLGNIERKVDALTHRDVPIVVREPEQAGLIKNQLFGSRTFAQHGEDLIILNLFRALGIERPTYMDIGAHHPYHLSNTALLYARGCRGINVEANPLSIEPFTKQRPEDVTLNFGVTGAKVAPTMTYYLFAEDLGLNTCDPSIAAQLTKQMSVKPKKIEVPTITIAEILQQHAGRRFPDLLNLDVEGMEEPLLRSIDYTASVPKLICADAMNDAAKRSISGFLSDNAYKLAFRAADNLFFVRSEWAGALGY